MPSTTDCRRTLHLPRCKPARQNESAPMPLPGEVLLGPCPSLSGHGNVGVHPLIVLKSDKNGIIVVPCSSKESQYCMRKLSVEERCAARLLSRSSTFIVRQLVRFSCSYARFLKHTGGRISPPSVHDIHEELKQTGAVCRAFCTESLGILLA